MPRIVILGCAGSGKTTLAYRLGARIGAPVICLDAIWQPQWGPDDIPAFRALMVETHAGDNWISDGNFAAATFDVRLPRAELIVWLDHPRFACAARAIARVFRRGEAHTIAKLPKVLAFIRNFDHVNRPKIEANRIAHGPNVPIRRLTNDQEVEAFLLSRGGKAMDPISD
jgi:adenylate kinase family enzyme